MKVASFLRSIIVTYVAGFLILRRNERDIIVNVHISSCTHYSCQILTKLEFSQQIFEKILKIFHIF